jgi:hypothetical protein
MISASDFKKCLQSVIEPSIKKVANQQDTSFENISNLAKNVDMCLYRNFGDEDLIVKGVSTRKDQVTELIQYFKNLIEVTSDQDISDNVKENYNINSEKYNNLKVKFMVDHFSKKIFQYCIEKYELEEPVEEPVEEPILKEIEEDDGEIGNAIKEYRNNKNVNELRIKITGFLVGWLTEKKETVNNNAVKQTVDKIIEVVTKINS